jgi:alkyldihydroxyacetonephosphate synthase
MDNEQFQFGQAMKQYTKLIDEFIDEIKKFLLTKVKGYDLNSVAVVTLVFEGEKEEVERQEKLIYEIANEHYGLNGGATNGQRGYVIKFFYERIKLILKFDNFALQVLTYVIAYIRVIKLPNLKII